MAAPRGRLPVAIGDRSETSFAEAICRMAMNGDPDHRSVNVALARPRKRSKGAKAGIEVTLRRPNWELIGVGRLKHQGTQSLTKIGYLTGLIMRLSAAYVIPHPL